jgi:protein TonB
VAGSSGGEPSGVGGAGAAGPPQPLRDDGRTQAYLRALQTRLFGLIHYPEEAERRRIEGTVRLTLTIAANGVVADARCDHGENTSMLQQAVLEAVRQAGRLPAPPVAQGRRVAVVTVPISFHLRPDRS